MTSNSDVLQKLLEKEPENDILAALLLDARAEEAGVDPDTVVAWVEHVRQCARDAHTMADAAAALKPGAPYRERLHSSIRSSCFLAGGHSINVVLVSGDAGPRATHRPGFDAGKFWAAWTIRVGAGWVLQKVQAMSRSASSEQRRARRRADRR